MKPTRRDDSFKQPGKVTPADRIMAELDGVYYRLSEVARMLGVSTKTLRSKIGSDLKAPSYQIVRGGMQMYLYTEEDIKELKEYFRR